jgi:hypothetical protein
MGNRKRGDCGGEAVKRLDISRLCRYEDIGLKADRGVSGGCSCSLTAEPFDTTENG